ncbi:hypothetical protein [Capnocytophaga ochracea]|nr:hypothetical protein [Capnocytophaga ochracea]
MKYILNIVIGVFMLVLLGCNVKEESDNPHKDLEKEKPWKEFIKEKLGIPAEAQITYETFGVVGYPSYLLAKIKKLFTSINMTMTTKFLLNILKHFLKI